MRGRLDVVVRTWTCSSGHLVEYDGAENGLFAAGPETVYVRVLLDAVLGVCVIACSTMAAASEYLTSFLRNTGAYAVGEDGQARQQVSKAVGEFTETLVVPDVAFQCDDCGEDQAEGGCCSWQGLSPVLMPLTGLAPASPYFGLRAMGRLSFPT